MPSRLRVNGRFGRFLDKLNFPGTQPLCKPRELCVLFGTSPRAVDFMEKSHPSLPHGRCGREVTVLVPGVHVGSAVSWAHPSDLLTVLHQGFPHSKVHSRGSRGNTKFPVGGWRWDMALGAARVSTARCSVVTGTRQISSKVLLPLFFLRWVTGTILGPVPQSSRQTDRAERRRLVGGVCLRNTSRSTPGPHLQDPTEEEVEL